MTSTTVTVIKSDNIDDSAANNDDNDNNDINNSVAKLKLENKPIVSKHDFRIVAWFTEVKAILTHYFDWDGLDEISCVLPEFLWLGCEEDARDTEKLNALGITHVLNCAGLDIPDIVYPSASSMNNHIAIETHLINADDARDFNMIQYFAECMDFINKCKQSKGRILIHCVAGMNRSSTVTVAYLMHSCDMHLLQAIEHTVKQRGWIISNDSFKVQLVMYASTLNKLCKYNWKPSSNNNTNTTTQTLSNSN